ncbi:MAG: SoxR reducing system RseC family protein [Nitrospinota bacterium]
MIEDAIVIDIDEKGTKVRMIRTNDCLSCKTTSKDSCYHEQQYGLRSLYADNNVAAEVGDMVTIEIAPAKMIKYSFLIYVLPIVFLFIGIGIGSWISSMNPQLGKADNISAIIGFLTMGLSIFILFFFLRKADRAGDMNAIISKKHRPGYMPPTA